MENQCFSQETEEDQMTAEPDQDSEDISDEIKPGDLTPQIDVEYALGLQQFAEQLYGSTIVDYEKLFYGHKPESSSSSPSSQNDEYTLKAAVPETASEVLTEEEANDTIKKIEYAALFGTNHDVSPEERRKLSWYIRFNPSYFSIFTANSLTNDVNYDVL